MKIKLLFFYLSFLFTFCFIVQTASLNLTKPHSTELVHKGQKTNDKSAVTLFKYSSELSKGEILSFYRNFFSKQNLVEQESSIENSQEEMIIFVDEKSVRAQLFFLSPYQGKSNYGLLIYDFDQELMNKAEPKKKSGKSKCSTCAE